MATTKKNLHAITNKTNKEHENKTLKTVITQTKEKNPL